MKKLINPAKKLTIPRNNILKNYQIPKNFVLIYGLHACKSALKNIKREKVLILTNKKNYKFWTTIVLDYQLRVKVLLVDDRDLDFISNKNVHQNVILIAKPLKRLKLIDYIKNNNSNEQKIILLDQVTDPQNIGSIIRSAFAFGFNAVGLLKNKSPFETSSIIKASSGEIEKVTLIELGNLINEINLLKSKGFITYGLANEGYRNIKDISINEKKIALIIGSEGKGLRSLTKKNLDEIFYIPIDKNCNSLNASNAAAIAMYQFGT